MAKIKLVQKIGRRHLHSQNVSAHCADGPSGVISIFHTEMREVVNAMDPFVL